MPPPPDGSRPGWPGHMAVYDRCGDFVKGIALAQPGGGVSAMARYKVGQ